MIDFDCPRCGQKVHAKDKYAGIEIHCPKCRQMIRIPTAGRSHNEKPAASPVNASADVVKIRCPGCHRKIGLELDFAGKTVICAKCRTPMQVPLPGQHRAVFQPQAPDLLDHVLDFDALLSPKEVGTSPDDADAGEMLGAELLKDELLPSRTDEPLKLASEQELQKPIPRIRCPKCGEMNPPEAGVCMLCSFEF